MSQDVVKENFSKLLARSPNDTGSPEMQIAFLTQRIKSLGGHFKTHKNDNHSKRGLLQMVNNRRKLLAHLKSEDITRYKQAASVLGLRT